MLQNDFSEIDSAATFIVAPHCKWENVFPTFFWYSAGISY